MVYLVENTASTNATALAGRRNAVYVTVDTRGTVVKGSVRQNTGRSLRAAASILNTSTEDLVNKGFKVVAGQLSVDRSTPILTT
jgi:N12 class adenine-specific DNA methylase